MLKYLFLFLFILSCSDNNEQELNKKYFKVSELRRDYQSDWTNARGDLVFQFNEDLSFFQKAIQFIDIDFSSIQACSVEITGTYQILSDSISKKNIFLNYSENTDVETQGSCKINNREIVLYYQPNNIIDLQDRSIIYRLKVCAEKDSDILKCYTL